MDWRDGLMFSGLLGLMGAGAGGLLGACVAGLKGGAIPSTALPNQGIALSVRSALLRGLLVGSSLGIAAGLVVGSRAGRAGGLTAGLVAGLLFGTLAALGGGLLDVIQHYTLRAVLVVRGFMPADYSRFLDYAARLVLLQRAGGGYLFIHRLLLEHFAEGKAGVAPGGGPVARAEDSPAVPIAAEPAAGNVAAAVTKPITG